MKEEPMCFRCKGAGMVPAGGGLGITLERPCPNCQEILDSSKESAVAEEEISRLNREIARLEKALADTEALWRQERDRRRELEAMREEVESFIRERGER